MFNGVGGSTILYNADWCRTAAVGLPGADARRRRRRLADLLRGPRAALRPRPTSSSASSGLAGDPSLPPTPRSRIRRCRSGAAAGWSRAPTTTSAGTGGRGRTRSRRRPGPACVQWGTCLEGCPAGAKASADLTHWRDAVAGGADLRTGARATRVVVDARGRRAASSTSTARVVRHVVEATIVVLAANGIGTPRLLLLRGLANRSGLVGRRLMVHPFATRRRRRSTSRCASWVGHAGPKIVSYEFYETDAARGFVRGAKWSLGGIAGPVGIALEGWAGWGEGHAGRMRELVGRTMSWGVFTEDLPEEANRVVLDDALTDSDGLPAPRVEYTISENTRRMLRFHADSRRGVAAGGGRARAARGGARARVGMAPAGDGAHGRRPGDVRGGPRPAGARRARALRRRRQRRS